MVISEESTTHAGFLQQPPPDELETVSVQTPEDKLAAYAGRLSNAYYRERQYRAIRFQNKRQHLCFKMDDLVGPALKQWKDISRKLCEAGVTNVERFIHAQFLSGPQPYPNQLVGETALKKFATYDTYAVDFLSQDWRSHVLVFTGGDADAAASYPQFSDSYRWDFVLRSSVLDLSPLFRYCIATSELFLDTAELFYAPALCQLLTDPVGYVRAWEGYIPSSLINEASAIVAITL